jgi:DNA-binding SARP family transcriptional activator
MFEQLPITAPGTAMLKSPAIGRTAPSMIALRLLGPVDLRGPDGRVLRMVLAQPKRLALLAYLAAARPLGFHSRDTLLALLWPELDQEHARAALRQAVYVLRHALGDDVFVGCGDSVLGVDPGKLWCDANALDEAVAAGDDAKAVELYRGELLEGFHVSGTQEFERWVDGARMRLAASASGAAWRLADAQAVRGDAPGELYWTRRLLAVCPDDERALRRMVSLLHRLGDRVAAIRVYEDFIRRMQADYGLQPSAQTQALIASVRERCRTA